MIQLNFVLVIAQNLVSLGLKFSFELMNNVRKSYYGNFYTLNSLFHTLGVIIHSQLLCLAGTLTNGDKCWIRTCLDILSMLRLPEVWKLS